MCPPNGAQLPQETFIPISYGVLIYYYEGLHSGDDDWGCDLLLDSSLNHPKAQSEGEGLAVPALWREVPGAGARPSALQVLPSKGCILACVAKSLDSQAVPWWPWVLGRRPEVAF